MNQATLNSVFLALVGSGLTFLASWYWFQRNAAVERAKVIQAGHAALLQRVSDVENKIALVNQAVIPISTAFQALLIKELTHYHTPEMDALMREIGPPCTLSAEKERRLGELLAARSLDDDPLISESERDAATILPYVIKRAKAEADVLDNAAALKLKLVTVGAIMGGFPPFESKQSES